MLLGLRGVVAHALTGLLCAAALWAWGYHIGGARSAAEHARAQAQAVAQAHQQYAERVALGERAALRLSERAIAAESAVARVKKEVVHVPVTVFKAVPGQCPAPGDIEFSAGAVRLWNSALSGADMPAGACGAAGAPAGACAAGAGIGIAQAHANAVENGARFQRCLAQLNALLDLVDKSDATPIPATPHGVNP